MLEKLEKQENRLYLKFSWKTWKKGTFSELEGWKNWKTIFKLKISIAKLASLRVLSLKNFLVGPNRWVLKKSLWTTFYVKDYQKCYITQISLSL